MMVLCMIMSFLVWNELKIIKIGIWMLKLCHFWVCSCATVWVVGHVRKVRPRPNQSGPLVRRDFNVHKNCARICPTSQSRLKTAQRSGCRMFLGPIPMVIFHFGGINGPFPLGRELPPISLIHCSLSQASSPSNLYMILAHIWGKERGDLDLQSHQSISLFVRESLDLVLGEKFCVPPPIFSSYIFLQ
jgi:hypothetical protein